ncbi:hypothetical protein TNCV_2939421 [Trichonephila clavipes]|nr:hypothetical protein TNCV_2939421 [Trichonephila clavipes]
MGNLPWRDQRFTKGNEAFKRAEIQLQPMSALDDLRLHGMRKMLRWCLNVFKKIVSSPKLALTCLPELAPSDFYLFPSKKKHLQGRRFVSSNKIKAASQEALGTGWEKMASSCASRSYTNASRSVSSPKLTTLKVDVLRCCELCRVRFYTPYPNFWIILRTMFNNSSFPEYTTAFPTFISNLSLIYRLHMVDDCQTTSSASGAHLPLYQQYMGPPSYWGSNMCNYSPTNRAPIFL